MEHERMVLTNCDGQGLSDCGEQQCPLGPEDLKYYTQVLINQEVCVPPQKPPKEKILSTNHKLLGCQVTPIAVRLDNGCIAGYKVLVQGKIRLGVEYSALVPDQEVHFVHFELPFTSLIADGPCQLPLPMSYCDMSRFHVRTFVEDLQVHQVDPRRLLAVVVLLLWLEPKHRPHHMKKCKGCYIGRTSHRVSQQLVVNPKLLIPPQKPPSEELLSHEFCPHLVKLKLIDTPLGCEEHPVRKVIVIGEVELAIKYSADCASQQVHAAHFCFPFSTLIEWQGGPPVDTPLDICVTTEYSRVEIYKGRVVIPVLILKLDVERRR